MIVCHLAKLQVSSASSCERNWSSYEFIHSKKRNRLNTERAEKLVYVHSNLRLLSRFTDPTQAERLAAWVDSDDETEVE